MCWFLVTIRDSGFGSNLSISGFSVDWFHMEIRYIDIHSHLNLEPLSERVGEVIEKMKTEGVATITVGTGVETSAQAVALAEQHPDMLRAVVGIHPTHRETGDWDTIVALAEHPLVVAIGETGFDFFRDTSADALSWQEASFRAHIELAVSIKKPLMIHARPSAGLPTQAGTDDAYERALLVLSEYPSARANFHFFTGCIATAQAIVAAGHTLSVDGPITFSRDYDEMLKSVPLESIMVETDAPFAAPAPHRGKTCEPWMVSEVAKKLADIRGEDREAVRTQLLQNSRKFFSLSPL
jgi:TatD DNase family protein